MKIVILLIFALSSCSSTLRVPATQTRVLFIGDSQTAGNLGKFTYEYLREHFNDSEIELYGVGGSSPRHWSSTPKEKEGKWLCSQMGRVNGKSNVKIEDHICKGAKDQMIYSHLNQKRSDYVVFQFLGNSMGFNHAYIQEKVDRLLGELGNQECLFITSLPFYYELEERNQLRKTTEDYFIKAIGNRCKVFAGMTKENFEHFAKDESNYLNDHIHLSLKGAEAFAKQFKSLLP